MVYVSSSCIRKNKISDVISILAENGIRNIELSGGTDFYDGITNDLIIQKEKYHLKYACHAYFPPPRTPFVVNLASCNDAVYKQSIEHYDNCLELLKMTGCDVLSVHAGFMIEVSKDEIGRQIKDYVVYDEDESYSRFCYAYEELSIKCKRQGIKLYLENNVLSRENYESFGGSNYFMMTDYKSIMYMLDQIKFNLLLDLGHLYVSCNTLDYDYETECRLLKEYVRWIHISENNGIQDEHRALAAESIIMKEFSNICKPGVNITLETSADIGSILQSKKLVEDSSKGEEHK